jgi:L-gulono-1,4-lactone dehydrogenase
MAATTRDAPGFVMTITRRGFMQRAGLAVAAGALGACRPCPTNVSGAILGAVDGVPCDTAHAFENWAHTIDFRPRRFCRPRTEAEVVAIIKDALATSTHVRTQGAGHSFSQLLPTSDTLVTLDDLQGSVSVDGTRATVSGGIRLKNLIPELRVRKLALKNLGSITEQSIAGAFSTGTHGTGLTLGAIPTQVVGVRLVTGNGAVHTIAEQDAQDLSAARINGGALGIITQVTLDCVPDHKLEYTAYLTTFDGVLPHVDQLIHENDRVTLWWLLPPFCPRDAVILITKNSLGHPVSDIILQGLEPEDGVRNQRLAKDLGLLQKLAGRPSKGGFRLKKIFHFIDDYDKVLTLPLLPVYHRECEYAIPVERTVEALRAMREIVEEGDISLSLPVEVRFVAHDDILLSPCYGRDVAYIGASTLANSTEVFERFEPLMKRLGGKPHWGKNATITQDEVAKVMYPQTYDSFRKVRDSFDPKRVFANSLLAELFP